MSVFIDTKYINLISSKLEKFSWKSSTMAICRCPLCGDSKKNKTKRRFYFYQEEGTYYVKCHNCQYAFYFSVFLKQFDANLYRQYCLETFGRNKDIEKNVTFTSKDTSKKLSNSILVGLDSIESLPETHYAKLYVSSRKIPKEFYSKLYFTEDYADLAQKLDPDKNDLKQEPRLVIPFFDETGSVFMMQGRSFEKNSNLRYISVKDPNYKGYKFYGLERHNKNKRTYFVEGPIDSMFLQNSIALAGADSIKECNLPCAKQFAVFVFDNEPYSREICKRIEGSIKMGYSVCMWPEGISQKDINEMVLKGYNPQTIVDSNIHEGLMALAKFKQWKKV